MSTSKLVIREILKARNITLRQLAELINVAPESLSRTLNGNPSLKTLNTIATVLDLDITDLFEKKNEISGVIRFNNNLYYIDSINELRNIYNSIIEGIE